MVRKPGGRRRALTRHLRRLEERVLIERGRMLRWPQDAAYSMRVINTCLEAWLRCRDALVVDELEGRLHDGTDQAPHGRR